MTSLELEIEAEVQRRMSSPEVQREIAEGVARRMASPEAQTKICLAVWMHEQAPRTLQ